MPLPELNTPKPGDLSFLKRLLESEKGHLELKPGFQDDARVKALEHHGYIRLSPAYTMFKTPTGTYFAEITAAGRFSLLYFDSLTDMTGKPCLTSH